MSGRMFWSSLLSVTFVIGLPIDAQAMFGKRAGRNGSCRPCAPVCYVQPPCIVWVPCDVVVGQSTMHGGAADDDTLTAPKKPVLKKIPDALPKPKAPPSA